MGAMLSYSLAAGVYLAVAWGIYRLLLAGAKQPGFNRLVLIVIYIAALIAPVAMPALGSLWSNLRSAVSPAEHPGGLLAGVVTATVAPSATPLVKALVWGYLLGGICVAAITIRAAHGLRRIIGQASAEERDGYTLLKVSGCQVPFSFMRYMVMSPEDASRDDRFITLHEQAHISRRHWIDLMLAQMVCVVMWYNPFAWLMRAELRRVHEYEADAAVLAAGVAARPYQELLIEKAVGVRLQSLANSLNHSNISKRITMMYQKPARRLRRLASLAILPSLALAALALRQPAVASTISAPLSADKVTETSSPVQAPDKLPEYPGGIDAMMRYLVTNMRYPEDAHNANKDGRVVVSFTVTAAGKVTDVKVIKSVYPSLDAEAVRIVNAMPDWTPGLNEEGQPVDCQFTLPVNFKLQGNSAKICIPSEPKVSNDDENSNPGMAVETVSEETIFFMKQDSENKKNYSDGKTENLTVYVNGKPYDGDLKAINPETIEEIRIDKVEGTIRIALKN